MADISKITLLDGSTHNITVANTLPIAKGGTGNTTGTATKVETTLDASNSGMSMFVMDADVNTVRRNPKISMRGFEHHYNTNASQHSETPSEATYSNFIVARDSGSANRAYLKLVSATDGKQGLQMVAGRNGVQHGFVMYIKSDGTRSVWFDDPAVWRSGLGLGSMATQSSSSYLPLTGGTLTGSLIGTYITSSQYYQVHNSADGYMFDVRNSDGSKHRAIMKNNINNQFVFSQYKDYSDNPVIESFALPRPDGSSSTSYDILTSKNAVTVAQGGTGKTTLTSGEVLIGNGANAVDTRGILDITSGATDIGYSTNTNKLITANTIAYWNGAYNSNGSSNLSKLGTVTSGTWQGTKIAAAYIGAHTNATAADVGQATGSVFGHVKLSDNYTSSAGGASSGIAASSTAVYSAYNACLKKDAACTISTLYSATAANTTLAVNATYLFISGHNSTNTLNNVAIVRTWWTASSSSGGIKIWPLISAGSGGSAITDYTMCGTVGLKQASVSATAAVITGATGGGACNAFYIRLL